MAHSLEKVHGAESAREQDDFEPKRKLTGFKICAKHASPAGAAGSAGAVHTHRISSGSFPMLAL